MTDINDFGQAMGEAFERNRRHWGQYRSGMKKLTKKSHYRFTGARELTGPMQLQHCMELCHLCSLTNEPFYVIEWEMERQGSKGSLVWTDRFFTVIIEGNHYVLIKDWSNSDEPALVSDKLWPGRVNSVAAEAARGVLDAVVAGGMTGVTRIWVSGFGNAAAAAVLVAAGLHRSGLPVAGVQSAGSPRVGDTDFAQWYNQSILGPRTVRFAGETDFRTHTPALRVGFEHVGVHIKLTATGAVHPWRLADWWADHQEVKNQGQSNDEATNQKWTVRRYLDGMALAFKNNFTFKVRGLVLPE
ncbi:hypothetical protein J8273_8908 [Carpediemonas membranifera]|uniref:Fungal lipase-type domain-containing protein n=1 Tax=Carpediemonas membranifera TaxID=201153 RepID=A0A8J6AQP5_9EUKA|nr:hypothetical protein J8273_8908 [Carpediemonas membranifera]|eukprot:KAG9389615.1 hypothetical protein J8273_8908 [Carpediemonas membranifera]